MSTNKNPIVTGLLYLLCVYDIYLYLPDTLDLFGIDFYPPAMYELAYLDAALLLFGGMVLGILLRKRGGSFNRYLGSAMILMNVVLTPLFIWRALP